MWLRKRRHSAPPTRSWYRALLHHRKCARSFPIIFSTKNGVKNIDCRRLKSERDRQQENSIAEKNRRTVTGGCSCLRFDLRMTLTRNAVKLTLKRLIVVSSAWHTLTAVQVEIRHRWTTHCSEQWRQSCAVNLQYAVKITTRFIYILVREKIQIVANNEFDWNK